MQFIVTHIAPFFNPVTKKDTRPQPSRVPFLPVYLLRLYLSAIPEGDSDFLAPADRDEQALSAPKAAVKVGDGSVK